MPKRKNLARKKKRQRQKCPLCTKKYYHLDQHLRYCKLNPDAQERLKKARETSSRNWKPEYLHAAHSPAARAKMGRTISEKHRKGHYRKSQHLRGMVNRKHTIQARLKIGEAIYRMHQRKQSDYLQRALQKADVIMITPHVQHEFLRRMPVARTGRDLWFAVDSED